MFENKIKFVATDGNMKDIWPNPKPASRFIPEEYKKLREAHKELQFNYEEVVEAHGGKEEIAKLITFANEDGSDVA